MEWAIRTNWKGIYILRKRISWSVLSTTTCTLHAYDICCVIHSTIIIMCISARTITTKHTTNNKKHKSIQKTQYDGHLSCSDCCSTDLSCECKKWYNTELVGKVFTCPILICLCKNQKPRDRCDLSYFGVFVYMHQFQGWQLLCPTL